MLLKSWDSGGFCSSSLTSGRTGAGVVEVEYDSVNGAVDVVVGVGVVVLVAGRLEVAAGAKGSGFDLWMSGAFWFGPAVGRSREPNC